MRPSPFVFVEFLYTGFFGCVVLGLGVLALFYQNPIGPVALTMVIGVLAIALNIALAFGRWRMFQAYEYALPHGILVKLNGYKATEDDFRLELQRFITLYGAYIKDVRGVLEREPIFVTFRPGSFTHPLYSKMRFAGLTMGSEVTVGYFRYDDHMRSYTDDKVPVEQTAFAHELGHVVLARAYGLTDNDRSHAWMGERRLP